MIAQYDGEITFIDKHIGLLIQKLKDLNIYNDTLIILTADHGEEFFEHEGWGHGHSLFQELIHVPLILRYPRIIPKGKIIPNVVQSIDIMPAILDIIKIPINQEAQGKSLLPLILQGSVEGEYPDMGYSETYDRGVIARSIRDQKYKLIYSKKGNKEKFLLFDLEKDKEELHNIFDQQPEIAKLMEKRLDDIYKFALNNKKGSLSVEIDSSTKEELKALGYIQ